MRKVGHERNILPVSFTINECVETEDSRFLAITIDVLHTGLNFNGSNFEKDVVDANADSIKNTPVLGYIALNPDGELDFQGHEYKTVKDGSGNKYVYAGSAYGVIPESCNYRWIEKVCSDGICREFFQVDALLWTKFDDAVTVRFIWLEQKIKDMISFFFCQLHQLIPAPFVKTTAPYILSHFLISNVLIHINIELAVVVWIPLCGGQICLFLHIIPILRHHPRHSVRLIRRMAD